MYGERAVRMLLALLVGLVLVVPASASDPIRLVFDHSEAAPHAFVIAKTARKGALLRYRKRVLTAYLQADPLVRLGRVVVNRKGNGTLRVYVPNVPPRSYAVLVKGFPGAGSRIVGSFGVLEGAAVADCDHAVFGPPSDDALARWPGFGPVHIALDPAVAMNPLRDRATREYFIKAGLALDAGPRATVAVALEDRTRVALAYVLGAPRRVTALDGVVTFEPCADQPYTGWAGGFVFRAPLCAHLTVTVAGSEPIPFTLPLGRACAS